MLFTGNFKLRKPELGEPVDVRDFNHNADVIDFELKNRPAADGNASEMTVKFDEATQLTELKSGGSLKSLFGKIALAIKKLISLEEALESHKNSHDHDGRYYTEEEIANILKRYVLADRIRLEGEISMSVSFMKSDGSEEEVMEVGNYCIITAGTWFGGHLLDGIQIGIGYDNHNKYTATYHNGELSRQWTAF